MFPLLLIGPSQKMLARKQLCDSDGGRRLTKLVKLGFYLCHHCWLVIIAEDFYFQHLENFQFLIKWYFLTEFS